MAYNNLSGTVYLPDNLITRIDVLTNSIVSGNLSYSDGADIINVPRVATPNANSLVINNNGNANNLRCDTELTFDGTTLSIVGNLTASINISASSFYGDGSNLTGISAGGGGTGGGIFTEINATKAYTTSSVQIGSSATPAHTMSVEGTTLLSGAVDVDGAIVPVTGDTYDLGSSDNPWRNLYISSSTIYFGTDTLSVGADNNLKFGSGSTTKGFDVGFMNFKNNGIFMDEGRLFKLRAYQTQIFGGIGYVRATVSNNYTIKDVDYLIGVKSNLLDSTIVLTLPAASTLLNGQTFIIKDEGGELDTYPLTISCGGTDTIDDQNSIILESPYASISIYCDGTGKYYAF
jgi:hypothetical protein